jgi:hypothetical protein
MLTKSQTMASVALTAASQRLSDLGTASVSASTHARSQAPLIPLLCSVCPKTPRFSDASHLLTHISSKGHLHAHQQMKIRSRSELAASASLTQYERWYKQYNIETLLAERLAAKDEKDATKRKARTLALMVFLPL